MTNDADVPLHSAPVQLPVLRSVPSQNRPWCCGAGLSHVRRRWCRQSVLHVDHDAHVDQPPSTDDAFQTHTNLSTSASFWRVPRNWSIVSILILFAKISILLLIWNISSRIFILNESSPVIFGATAAPCGESMRNWPCSRSLPLERLLIWLGVADLSVTCTTGRVFSYYSCVLVTDKRTYGRTDGHRISIA